MRDRQLRADVKMSSRRTRQRPRIESGRVDWMYILRGGGSIGKQPAYCHVQ